MYEIIDLDSNCLMEAMNWRRSLLNFDVVHCIKFVVSDIDIYAAVIFEGVLVICWTISAGNKM